MAISITDPMAPPVYANGLFQRFCASLVKDGRDVVFVRLTLKVLLILFPLLGFLFWRFHWGVLAVYLALNFWFVSPVILMLHCTMHRPFFKSALATRLHGYVMSAVFGIPTGYSEHHIGMHHAENNVGDDLSATYHYERDNFFHWVRYVSRFFFLIQFELSAYFVKKKKPQMAIRAIGTDLLHIALVVVAWRYDARIGFFCFLLPLLVVRTMMMVGNWGQHAFIDPARPQVSYVNSITCINSGYNTRCFNDGYHIGHHLKPNRRWDELPKDFLDNLERYAKEGCIVFKETDFFMVAVLLFLRRYDILAKKFVSIDGVERTQPEVEAFLKARTRPVPVTVSIHDGAPSAA